MKQKLDKPLVPSDQKDPGDNTATYAVSGVIAHAVGSAILLGTITSGIGTYNGPDTAGIVVGLLVLLTGVVLLLVALARVIGMFAAQTEYQEDTVKLLRQIARNTTRHD